MLVSRKQFGSKYLKHAQQSICSVASTNNNLNSVLIHGEAAVHIAHMIYVLQLSKKQ